MIFGSIRSRLLTLIVAPLLLLILVLANQFWKEYQAIREMEDLTHMGIAIGALVHEVQIERGITAGFLASHGASFSTELMSQRERTRSKMMAMEEFFNTFNSARYGKHFQQTLQVARESTAKIKTVQAQVDSYSVPIMNVIRFYSEMNALWLKLVQFSVELTPDTEVSLLRAAYQHFMQAKEAAGIERALMNHVFTDRAFHDTEYDYFQRLIISQDTDLEHFKSLANAEQLTFYEKRMSAPVMAEVQRLRDITLARGKGASKSKAQTNTYTDFGIDPIHWFKSMTTKINLLKEVEDRLAIDMRQHISKLSDGARAGLLKWILFTSVLVTLLFAAAIRISRGISRPLHEAIQFAGQVAANDFSGTLVISRQDEMSTLAQALNQMSENLRTTMEEQTHQQQQLHKMNELLEGVFATTEGQIAYMDTAFNFIRVSRGYAAAVDRSQEYFTGKNHFELFPDAENEAIFKQVVTSGKPYMAYAKPFEYSHELGRGVTYWDWSLFPAKDANGKVDGLVLTLANVTERVEAEAALRESEARYQDLYDNAPDMYVSVDSSTGCIRNCNQTLADNLGYEKVEIIGKPIFDMYHPDCLPEVKKTFQHFIETGEVYDTELQLKRKDGSSIDVSLNVSAVRDENGNILYSRSSWRDITAHKKAEEALRLTQFAVDHAGDAVFWSTYDGGFVSVNQRACDVLGYSREELLGMTVHDIDPEFPKAAWPTHWRELQQKGSMHIETRHQRKDGHIFPVDVSISLVEYGGVEYNVAFARDITDRKSAEEALHQSEKSLAEAQRIAHLGNWEWDIKTGDLSWSDEACRIFGFAPQEIKASYDKFMQAIHPDDHDLVIKSINNAVAGNTPYDIEHRIITPDGDTRIVQERGKVFLDESGKHTRMVGTVLDITDRKAIEIALQQAKEEAEAANRGKSTFLANMSHELRTPLNAILGFSHIIERSPELPDEQRKNLDIITSSGEHLLSLICEILDMAKIESGRITLDKISFDFYLLLGEIEDMFRLEAEGRGLRLFVECQPGVPHFIYTDEVKLRQVLINLLSNAVKFTDAGSISLTVNAEDIKTNGEAEDVRLLFEIEDTGYGIAEDEVTTLFDAFVQTRTGKQAPEGTGLGLAISKQFVLLMGGDISVTSREGKGSCFKFVIPVKLAEADEVQVPKPARRVIALEEGQAQYRMLVVDDRWNNRQLMIKLLEPLGFELREACNGQEAIDIWVSWEPHLIWMDLRMPVMNGYDAAKQIKATTQGQATVVIAVTASTFEAERSIILSTGVDDVLRKPFRESDIMDLIQQHLGVRFVYEDDESLSTLPKPIELTPRALAGLPADLRKALQEAVINGDLSKVTLCINEISLQDSRLAEALSRLADEFEFDSILQHLQPERESPHEE